MACAGRVPLRPSRVDVGEVLETLAERIRVEGDDSASVIIGEICDRPFAHVDRAGLETALRHLADNALEAVAGTGAVRLHCTRTRFSGDGAFAQSKPHGEHLAISIEDDGEGMERETQRRACRPLFSTRGGGRHGMGLGVAAGFAEFIRLSLPARRKPKRTRAAGGRTHQS